MEIRSIWVLPYPIREIIMKFKCHNQNSEHPKYSQVIPRCKHCVVHYYQLSLKIWACTQPDKWQWQGCFVCLIHAHIDMAAETGISAIVIASLLCLIPSPWWWGSPWSVLCVSNRTSSWFSSCPHDHSSLVMLMDVTSSMSHLWHFYKVYHCPLTFLFYMVSLLGKTHP